MTDGILQTLLTIFVLIFLISGWILFILTIKGRKMKKIRIQMSRESTKGAQMFIRWYPDENKEIIQV